MKKLLKKIMPKALVDEINFYRFAQLVKKGLSYACKRYMRYANTYDTKEAFSALLQPEHHGYHAAHERNWLYVDTGILTMNMAYALQYYNIGAVILNWNMQEKHNYVFYDLLTTTEDLTISVMIAIRNLPDTAFAIRRKNRPE